MVQFFLGGGGGGADNEIIPTFQLWKRGVIWLMSGVGTGTSCRQLCKGYTILTVTSLYVPEVICCVKKYKFSPEHNVHIHDYD